MAALPLTENDFHKAEMEYHGKNCTYYWTYTEHSYYEQNLNLLQSLPSGNQKCGTYYSWFTRSQALYSISE